jgi:hypothetical protein
MLAPAMQRLPRSLQRLVEIGALSSDSAELRLRKAVLVLSSTLMASLAAVWIVTFAVLGRWLPAAIPLAYQLATAVSLATFARTRRYILFRQSQLCMSLLLPFALQWSLGGFERSSAVCLWAVTAPLGALLFVGARQAIPWFAARFLRRAATGSGSTLRSRRSESASARSRARTKYSSSANAVAATPRMFSAKNAITTPCGSASAPSDSAWSMAAERTTNAAKARGPSPTTAQA